MITIKAPAKINLNLLVTGRRDDGLHLIDSLAVLADLTDGLSLTESDTDSFECRGPMAAALAQMQPADNLVLRARDIYREAAGWDQKLAVSLEKNIPVAAGIGGGSADAAAMLHGINKMAGGRLDDADLAELGLRLGADVPVCLKSTEGPAWRMRGIGEQLDQVTPPFSTDKGPGLVLINTGIAVPTGAVFAARAESRMPFAAAAVYPAELDQKGWEQLCHLGNSLAEAAQIVCPEIDEAAAMIADLAKASGATYWGMSGSGATFFALFDTIDAAHHAIAQHPPHCWHWAGGLFRAETGE